MPALPPPPPAEVRPAPQPTQTANAESYGAARVTSAVKRLPADYKRRDSHRAHAWHPKYRNPHTNRLHSRKQAKLRAKRRAKR